MRYKTEIVGSSDGKGSIGYASIWAGAAWRPLGSTNTYAAYPADVRARAGAEALCRKHWLSSPFGQRIGTGLEIVRA